jgi:hypothetical protein
MFGLGLGIYVETRILQIREPKTFADYPAVQVLACQPAYGECSIAAVGAFADAGNFTACHMRLKSARSVSAATSAIIRMSAFTQNFGG